jgi:alpha/beta superfamily hydrolase
LTGSLRLRLNDLGYTTLAIQMPIAAKEATVDDYYPALFPEAGARLQAASAWLRGKGHTNVALVSHTFGSWMANVYLDKGAQDRSYQAWVCISLTGGYSFAVRNYPFPVLDLYGENDIPVTVSSAWRRNALMRLAASGSRQQMVPGADAQWRGKEQAAAQAIADFLRQQF